MSAANGDTRSTAELFKQWRKLMEVQRQLTKNGMLSADATPAEVVAKLRDTIPADIFGGGK